MTWLHGAYECCEPACPSDCSGCNAIKFTATGETGCCCVIAHLTNQNMTRSGCEWSHDESTGSPDFAAIEYRLTCIAGSPDRWRFRIEIVSVPSTCTGPTCSSAAPDIWEGFIDATACPNPGGTGTYVCAHVSGPNCSGTITVTVIDQ